MKLEKLKPEEKVNLSINMVDVVRAFVEGIKVQNKNINERAWESCAIARA